MPRSFLRGRRVIGFWVWELDVPPPHWGLGRGWVHEVWTPSAFSATAARRAFDAPVHVIPHAVALAPPPQPNLQTRAAARAALDVKDDHFLVATSFSLSSSLARKNPVAALDAFEGAFANRRNCHLIIRMAGGSRFPEAAGQLERRVRASHSNVRVVSDQDRLPGLHALYAACDVYISLHRSEGFGLNLAEAMLCRRPVIATAYSGNLDFMDNDSAALVPAAQVAVSDPQGIYRLPHARWAEPDHEAAAQWLRILESDPARRDLIGAAGEKKARTLLSGGAAIDALRMT